MCLTIKARRPIKASKDLHCFKNLKGKQSYITTPTFYEKIVFHHGYFVQKTDCFGFYKYRDWDRDQWMMDINEGIHSFYKKKCEWVDCTSFHAVIPKGTLMYFSDFAFTPLAEVIPVVSLKLIIFKTYFHYLLYKLGWLKVK